MKGHRHVPSLTKYPIYVFSISRGDGGDAEVSLFYASGNVQRIGKYWCRLLRYVVTASKRNFLEIPPPLSSSLLLPPLPRHVLTRETHVGGERGRGTAFVFGQNTPRGGTEGGEKRVILEEGARIVRCSSVFPPLRFGLQPRRSGTSGTSLGDGASVSLSLSLPSTSLRSR